MIAPYQARVQVPKKTVNIKQFRHAVSILKKQGLISDIDASKAQPWMVRGGQRLTDTIKKYDDVVSGKTTAVKLPEKKTAEYRKAGYQISKGRVMVPHAAGETVKITPKKEIEVKHPSGITRVKKAIPFQNLEQWLRDNLRRPDILNSTKAPKEYFAYKFKGYNSYQVYPDAYGMLDDLVNGSVSGLNLMDKAQHSTRKQQNELYQDLEIVTVPRREVWTPTPGVRVNAPERMATSKAARKRYLERVKGTAVGQRIREANKQRQKEWRDKLSGRKLEQYKKKGRKRAKKSSKKASPKRKK
jgi:hypothetical protein